jgi:hypothetical protein
MAVNHSVGDHPIAVAVGEFNGDGRADLVVANKSSHDVRVLLGMVDVCEGLSGRAWGLCIAALAAGCDEEHPSNPSVECAQLAEHYSDETGEEPPWIESVNDPPVAINDYYTTVENTALYVPAPGVLGNDTDPEGDSLTAVMVSTVSNGTLTLNANGSFIYTPNPQFNGTDSFTYKANDGNADSAGTATVIIEVTAPVNQPPVATAGPDQNVTDMIVLLDGSASYDPDGTIVSYEWSEWGSRIAGDQITEVIFAVGSHIVTLTVTDNDGATATDTVIIEVTAP